MKRTIASVFIASSAFLTLGFMASEASASPVDGLPSCQYEDGNPDGLPCVWTSPKTGKLYYNDGSEYRN